MSKYHAFKKLLYLITKCTWYRWWHLSGYKSEDISDMYPFINDLLSEYIINWEYRVLILTGIFVVSFKSFDSLKTFKSNSYICMYLDMYSLKISVMVCTLCTYVIANPCVLKSTQIQNINEWDILYINLTPPNVQWCKYFFFAFAGQTSSCPLRVQGQHSTRLCSYRQLLRRLREGQTKS